MRPLRDGLYRTNKVVGLDGVLPPAGRERSLIGSKPRPIKKWPDDFRGFGTNVKPRKAK